MQHTGDAGTFFFPHSKHFGSFPYVFGDLSKSMNTTLEYLNIEVEMMCTDTVAFFVMHIQLLERLGAEQ